LKTSLKVVGSHETRDTDVLFIKLKTSNVPGLKPYKHDLHSGTWRFPPGKLVLFDQTLASKYPSAFQNILENLFSKPIVFDQAGLTKPFDINLTWDEPDPKHPNIEGLKQALLDQLGLELVPTNMPIEMLVVEMVK
jgi:uncharacterized protein (TIGR03435 family)